MGSIYAALTLVLFVTAVAASPAAAAPGDLDTAFGSGGATVSQLSTAPSPETYSQFFASALQSDGKVVAAGNAHDVSGNTDVLVARYLSNGTLDPSFGPSGTGSTALQLGDTPMSPHLPQSLVTPHGVAIQADGKIVVAGEATDAADNNQALVARFLPNGALDPSFGSGGRYVAQLGGSGGMSALDGVAIQSDGKIVITGDQQPSGAQPAFVAVRLTSAGKPDPSFGTGGVVTKQLGLGPSASQQSVGTDTIISGGEIVICGGATDSSGNLAYMLTRLTSVGAFDPSFGTGGVTIQQVSDKAGEPSAPISVGMQSGGQLVLAGPADLVTGSPQSAEIAVARFTSGGQLDTSFASGGVALSQPSPYSTPFSEDLGLAIQFNDKIVVDGSDKDLNGNLESVVERYTPSGSLDSSFGGVGIVKHRFDAASPASTQGNNILVQPDGKLVDAGQASDSNGNLAGFVARYFGDPPPAPRPNSDFSFEGVSVERNGTIDVHLLAPNPGTFSIKATTAAASVRGASVEGARKKCRKGFVRKGKRCKQKQVLFGRASRTVAPGAVVVKVHPNAATRRALKAGKRLNVLLSVRFQSALGGSPVSKQRRIKVRIRKSHKKRHAPITSAAKLAPDTPLPLPPPLSLLQR